MLSNISTEFENPLATEARLIISHVFEFTSLDITAHSQSLYTYSTNLLPTCLVTGHH